MRSVDQVLDTRSIPLVSWLLLIAVGFFIVTLASELLASREKTSKRAIRANPGVHWLLIITSLITLSSYVYSYISGYYYSIYVTVGIIAQLIALLLVSLIYSKTPLGEKDRAMGIALHLSAMTIIFVVSARWLIRGVDVEETSADTLNIYYNGGYRYSMHAGWYDLAPVDSLLKVMNLRLGGLDNPYSPYENFLFSFSSGLLVYLLLYSYLKKRNLWHTTPLLTATLAIHPYAILSNLYVTPVNITLSLAMASIIVLMRSADKETLSFYLTAGLLYATSVLSHPFSLATLLFLLAFIIARFIDRSLRQGELLTLVMILILWSVKIVYTATIYGVVNMARIIVRDLLMLWERETVIIMRSPRYAELPRLSLASFSASIGIMGALSLIVLYMLYRQRRLNTARNKWRELMLIVLAFFSGVSGIIAAIGGYSRYVFVPFASLFPIGFILYNEVRDIGKLAKIAIVAATILTVLSPNFMPDQYYIPMAAKISDNTFFTLSSFIYDHFDPRFVIDRFYWRTDARMIFYQNSPFKRTSGVPGLIVDKIILKGVINARSYWDFSGRGPLDPVLESIYQSNSSIILNCELFMVHLSWIGN